MQNSVMGLSLSVPSVSSVKFCAKMVSVLFHAVWNVSYSGISVAYAALTVKSSPQTSFCPAAFSMRSVSLSVAAVV